MCGAGFAPPQCSILNFGAVPLVCNGANHPAKPPFASLRLMKRPTQLCSPVLIRVEPLCNPASSLRRFALPGSRPAQPFCRFASLFCKPALSLCKLQDDRANLLRHFSGLNRHFLNLLCPYVSCMTAKQTCFVVLQIYPVTRNSASRRCKFGRRQSRLTKSPRWTEKTSCKPHKCWSKLRQ